MLPVACNMLAGALIAYRQKVRHAGAAQQQWGIMRWSAGLRQLCI